MTDKYEALRNALSGVNPCGAFHKSGRAVDIDETEEWPAIRVEVRANQLVAPKVARYIATANPTEIAVLIAERDALREALMGRHVHLGKVAAVQVCCNNQEQSNA